MCEDAVVYDNMPQARTLEEGKSYMICSCGKADDGIICDGNHKGTSCTPVKIEPEKTKQHHICMCKSSNNFPYCDGTHSIYSDEAVGKSVQT